MSVQHQVQQELLIVLLTPQHCLIRLHLMMCGALCDPEKSMDEICQLVSNLSVDEKFSLLFQHVTPPAVLPFTFSHGFQRRFSLG